MQYFEIKYLLSGLIISLLTTTFYSWKKNDNKTLKKLVTLETPDSMKAYPGLLRMALSWEVKYPAIKKTVAFCNPRASILEIGVFTRYPSVEAEEVNIKCY